MKISRQSGLTRIFPPRMQNKQVLESQIIELLLWNVRARNREKDTQTHANKFPWKRDSSSVFSLSNTHNLLIHIHVKSNRCFCFDVKPHRVGAVCVCVFVAYYFDNDELTHWLRGRETYRFLRVLSHDGFFRSRSPTRLLSFIALGVRWCWHTGFRGELI